MTLSFIYTAYYLTYLSAKDYSPWKINLNSKRGYGHIIGAWKKMVLH